MLVSAKPPKPVSIYSPPFTCYFTIKAILSLIYRRITYEKVSKIKSGSASLRPDKRWSWINKSTYSYPPKLSFIISYKIKNRPAKIAGQLNLPLCFHEWIFPKIHSGYFIKSTNWLKLFCMKSMARFGMTPNRIVPTTATRMTTIVPAGSLIFSSLAAGRKNICVMTPK